MLMLGVGGGGTAATVIVDASFAFASAAAVAVITVIPAATAVTTPVVGLTVAAAGLLETKLAAWLVELVTTTVMASVWPTCSVAVSGSRLIATGGGGGCTTCVSSHAPSSVAPSISPSSPNLRVVISAPPRAPGLSRGLNYCVYFDSHPAACVRLAETHKAQLHQGYRRT